MNTRSPLYAREFHDTITPAKDGARNLLRRWLLAEYASPRLYGPIKEAFYCFLIGEGGFISRPKGRGKIILHKIDYVLFF